MLPRYCSSLIGLSLLWTSLSTRASCEITYGRLAEFQPPAYHYSSLTLGADGCAYTVSVYASENGGQQLQRIDAEGRIETVVIFGVDNDLKSVQPWLVKGPDGSLYGCASQSTPTPHSVIYRLTAAGLIEVVANGSFIAPPVLGGDGALYGRTGSPGITRLRTDGVIETVPGTESIPANDVLVAGGDGSLYFNSWQKIWKVGADGVLSEVARFDYETPTYATLGYYLPDILLRGKSGVIYGASAGGGPEERGVIFKITSTGAVEPVVAYGSEPGRIDGYSYKFNLAEGAGGTLVHLTNAAYEGHNAFAIDAAGSATMIGSLPPTSPESNKLVTGSDDEVYAAYCAGDYLGDVFGKRSIVKLSTTTGCTIVGQTPEPEFLDGEQVQSAAIVGPNGGVWAISSKVFGLGSFAHLIRLRADGTFEEPALVSGTALPGKNPTELRTLSDGSIAGVSGEDPMGSSGLFKIQADGSIRFLTDLRGALTAPVEFDDGSLVGVTAAGGVGYGSVYRVEPNGRKSIVHFNAGGFPGPVPSPNGSYPTGSLVKGSDGAWYGLTQLSGGFFDGNVFKVSPSFEVQSVPTFYGDYLLPVGSFVDGGDGALYAITAGGGAYGFGGLIRFVPNPFGGEITLAASFSEMLATPFSSSPITEGPKLVLGSDGWFYGVTNYKVPTPSDPSEVGPGFVFRVSKTGAFEVMARFTGQTGLLPGAKPRPFLTLAADGFFYGVTESGGTHNAGTVFRVNPAGRVVNIASFTGTAGRIAGSSPTALIRRGNVLFGACAKGGASDAGTLFRIDNSRYVSVVKTLTGIGGATPGGAPNSLTLGLDGNIYGTGGADSLAESNSPLGLYGTVFQLEITDPPASASAPRTR